MMSTRLLLTRLIAVATLLCVCVPISGLTRQQSSAQVEDLVLGVWVLNVAKSTYSSGPPPRSQTRTYEAHDKGVKASIVTVYADGQSTSTEYVAAYDSIEYPLTGSPNSDGIALKKIDAFTAEVTVMHGGKPVGTARRVISADGKTMTITYQGQWAGKPAENVMVYEREGAAAASSGRGEPAGDVEILSRCSVTSKV
jgi:hypothetical protein